MEVKVNNKIVKINDNEIKKLMKNLEITEAEAIETWLSDNDYVNNEQIEILTKKAKENKTDKIVASDKTTRKKAERQPKENPIKEQIIDILASTLRNELTPELIQITNKSKLIEFTYFGKQFKLDLIEKRIPKEK